MYKLEHVNKEDVELDYCDLTNFNSLPTPFEIITEEEWRQLRYRWANNYYDFRQIMNKEHLLKLFGSEDGLAQAHIDYNSGYAVAEIIKYNGEDLSERVYVKIGCQHEWEYVEGDSISTTHKCKKCGTVVETPTGR